MPEGPELRMNSMFINKVCSGLVFGGRPIRSPVSMSPEIEWVSPKYTITSESRGKELVLLLQCQKESDRAMRILFRFGMSGKFNFTTSIASIPKHAHLQFHRISEKMKERVEGEGMGILSFVDTRRFGSWREIKDGWGKERGPDIVTEYELFRANILGNLGDPVFGKAMCEAMLNQKYFNGIGNYLRAEILFRAKIPPFTCTRSILLPLNGGGCASDADPPDVLALCRDISLEVINLKSGLGEQRLMSESVSESEHRVFLDWLRCYNNPNMRIIKDKIGRSVWFQGEPGPMAPKGGKIKKVKRARVPDNPNPSATPSPEAALETQGQDGMKAKRRRSSHPKKPPAKKCGRNDDPLPHDAPRRSARLQIAQTIKIES